MFCCSPSCLNDHNCFSFVYTKQTSSRLMTISGCEYCFAINYTLSLLRAREPCTLLLWGKFGPLLFMCTLQYWFTHIRQIKDNLISIHSHSEAWKWLFVEQVCLYNNQCITDTKTWQHFYWIVGNFAAVYHYKSIVD